MAEVDIQVLYFAAASTSTGLTQETVSVPINLPLSLLGDLLVARHPKATDLRKILDGSQWSVDAEMVDDPKGVTLRGGEEVAVICPVTVRALEQTSIYELAYAFMQSHAYTRQSSPSTPINWRTVDVAPMTVDRFTFTQNMLNGIDQPLQVILIPENHPDFDGDLLSVFSESSKPLGLAAGYSNQGRLAALAISDDKHCLIIRFLSGRRGRDNGAPSSPPNSPKRQLLQDLVLNRVDGDIVAFDCAELAMALYRVGGFAFRMKNGIDVQSAFGTDRAPLSAIKAAFGGDASPVVDRNVKNVFRTQLFDLDDRQCKSDLAGRAWIAQYLATVGNVMEKFAKQKKINTDLEFLAQTTSETLRLSNMKPNVKKHELATHQANNGEVKLASYTTRARRGEDTVIQVQTRDGYTYVDRGRSGAVDGCSARLEMTSQLDESKTILSIKSVRRDKPTQAEARAAATVLSALQGGSGHLNANPWIDNILYPNKADGNLNWPGDWSTICPVPPSSRSTSKDNLDRLNASQQEAVQAMLQAGNEHRVVLVQGLGPPGTGKTSVIAAYVQTALDRGQSGIWLVAQSNVAVINIAFKLQAIGFEDWCLLGSDEFSHEDWHGHLYRQIKHKFIRSHEFNKISDARMRGCKVILCTLDMISTDDVKRYFVKYVPVERVIVDEASQIRIGLYLNLFKSFSHSLRKMSFIGDNKQLPPHGQESLGDLQSIFEVTHLQTKTYFLDTQYRMPPQIGAFISAKVYNNKLKSSPDHPVSDTEVACYFVDVVGSKELHNNKSYSNKLEAMAIIQLAQHLQAQGRSYKIITPYDGQRVLIERAMKETDGLDWKEKVYNVDSFQGNEEDIILISITRTQSLGFLRNMRRANGMLSRCKRAMYIFSSRAFLQRRGKDWLVGELSRHVGNLGWLQMKDLEMCEFLTSPRKREIHE
ncbi:AAA-12 domain-containing protein [Mycena kentingensis (nom. inval.)]|nr:AAA-12 domain-containing protein [Mycena kentingensis (nom. inval.)]